MRNINVVTLGQFDTPTCFILLYAVYFIITKYVTDENLKNTMYIPYFRDVSESQLCHAKFCFVVPPHPLSVSDLTTLMHVSRLKSRLNTAPVKMSVVPRRDFVVCAYSSHILVRLFVNCVEL